MNPHLAVGKMGGFQRPDRRGANVIKLSPTRSGVKVTFTLPLEQSAGECSVVGDFNEWQPGVHAMRRRPNETQSASVTLPRGTRVRFRYLAENGHWFNDPDVHELDGSDSVLSV
jgi:1,4-alpha-glucan branching enzyme